MTSITQQDAAELTQCYVALAAKVFRYARARPGVDVSTANDLVQKAFQDTASHWADLRGKPDDERLKILCTTVARDAIDAVRRRGTAYAKQEDVWRLTRHATDDDPFDAVCLKLLKEKFNEEIDKMPPQRRRVAELKWGLHLRNKEIAADLGITAKAVSAHVAAVRNTLRTARQQFEGNDDGAWGEGSDR